LHRTQYTVIAKMAGVALVLIVSLYMSRDPPASMGMTAAQLANVTAVSFVTGAFLSALAGYAGMWCAVRANSRVGAAAATSYNAAIQVALRSGAIAALLVVSLVLLGICMLFTLFCAVSGGDGGVKPHKIPLLLVGYGVRPLPQLVDLLLVPGRCGQTRGPTG
jgi:K(+)-stimulated pyrophosphate-energized sodium pump